MRKLSKTKDHSGEDAAEQSKRFAAKSNRTKSIRPRIDGWSGGTDDARFAPSKIATMTEGRPYAGARNSPKSQPTVSLDFIGSISSTMRWWMWPQAGHSKVRISKPEESGVMHASIVAALHLGHGGL